MPARPRLRPLPLLTLLPLLAGCELTEVTVAPGTRVVVVQSVISRTDSLQFVIVEYSQAGQTIGGFSYPRIPPGSPKAPISSARVTIEHTVGACAGRVDTLLEQPPMDAEAQETGTYAGPICRPEPGEELLLRVETPAGEVVTGATVVPGASARDVSTGDCPMLAGGTCTLNRERDTLGIGVTPISGKAMQVELRGDANREDLAIYAYTDTLGIRFPGNLVNPFEGDGGESVFRAGRYYALAVALTDDHYYDFLRSRSDPFTGRGFINHLTGGIGVFGSVETERYRLRVVAPLDGPLEGVYRLTGLMDSVPVDVTFELYLDEIQPEQVSAFVRGAWWDGPVDVSGDGWFDPTGEFLFYFDTHQRLGYGPQFLLQGMLRPSGEPFPLTVRWFDPDSRVALEDTLTAERISGPGLATASPRR
jgi:hypothetical protein